MGFHGIFMGYNYYTTGIMEFQNSNPWSRFSSPGTGTDEFLWDARALTGDRVPSLGTPFMY
jgi:hypothetical protein